MTALKNQVNAFITFESDLKKIIDHIPIINPKNNDFKDIIQALK